MVGLLCTQDFQLSSLAGAGAAGTNASVPPCIGYARCQLLLLLLKSKYASLASVTRLCVWCGCYTCRPAVVILPRRGVPGGARGPSNSCTAGLVLAACVWRCPAIFSNAGSLCCGSLAVYLWLFCVLRWCWCWEVQQALLQVQLCLQGALVKVSEAAATALHGP